MNIHITQCQQHVYLEKDNMCWRLFISLFLGFLTIGLAMLAGRCSMIAHYDSLAILFIAIAIDAMLFSICFARDHGSSLDKYLHKKND